MQANSPPTRVDTLQLYTLEERPSPWPGFAWISLHCTWAACSPCGCYLAVVVEGKQCGPENLPTAVGEADEIASPGGSNCDMSFYEVLVYRTSVGNQQQARLLTGVRPPVIQWSASGSLLIAQLFRYNTNDFYQAVDLHLMQELSVQSAAFTWSPERSAVLHCLDQEASAALQMLSEGCTVYGIWSPSCQYLLMHGAGFPVTDEKRVPGWVAIAEVAEGRIIAQSGLELAWTFDANEKLSIAWHPTSRGLVFRGDIHIHDMGIFAQAGFATGLLPAQLRMHPVGFSADASHLVAQWQSSPSLMLVSCNMHELQIDLVQARPLLVPGGSEEVRPIGWLPGFATMLLERKCADGTSQPLTSEAGAVGPCGQADYARSASRNRISPSGRLSFSESYCPLRMFEVQSGRQCWDSHTPGAGWAGAQMEGMLCGQGAPQTLGFQAWLPSGLGLVCDAMGGDHPDADEAYLSPIVHICWFV